MKVYDFGVIIFFVILLISLYYLEYHWNDDFYEKIANENTSFHPELSKDEKIRLLRNQYYNGRCRH